MAKWKPKHVGEESARTLADAISYMDISLESAKEMGLALEDLEEVRTRLDQIRGANAQSMKVGRTVFMEELNLDTAAIIGAAFHISAKADEVAAEEAALDGASTLVSEALRSRAAWKRGVFDGTHLQAAPIEGKLEEWGYKNWQGPPRKRRDER